MIAPATWKRTRVDRVATVNARIGWKALTASEYQQDGYVFLATPNIKSESIDFEHVNYISEYRYEESPELKLQPGDVLLAKDGNTLGINNIVRELPRPATVNGSIAVLRAFDIEPRFLRYSLASSSTQKMIEAIKGGMGVPHLFQWDIKRLPILLPPLATQRAIADYLDSESVRIDALVAAKRRILELLGEWSRSTREALVSEAWRQGRAMRLGYLLNEIDDRLGTGEAPPLLSVSIHHGVIPFAEANPDREPRADDLKNYKKCRRDDIVLNRMRAFQGGIGRAAEDGIVSPDYAVLRPTAAGFSRYLNHLLRSPWFVGKMEALLRGIGGVEQGNVRTPRVNWDDLRTVMVPSPSIHTQMALAERLDDELNTSSRTQLVLDRQIELIQERRQALITATVTGQLDIPEAA